MGQGYMPGMAGRGFGSGFGSAPANNSLNQGTNNIGQVYQDMGQNYQRFGQAYQQATQAANQLRSASTTQQQQMNQYLQALQTALGGLSTAGQNTTNQQPMGQPAFGRGGFTPTPTLGINQAGGVPGINADQQNAYGLSQDQIAQLQARGLSQSDMFINGATYNDLINGTGQSEAQRLMNSAQPTLFGQAGLNAGIQNTAYYGPQIINDPEIQTGIQNWYNARTTAANQAGFTTGSEPGYGQFITDYENQFGSSRPQYRYLTPEQQSMINAQTQAFTGTIAPAYQQAVSGATGLYGSPSMNPQDFYNQYASVLFGDQASAYTPNFQG